MQPDGTQKSRDHRKLGFHRRYRRPARGIARPFWRPNTQDKMKDLLTTLMYGGMIKLINIVTGIVAARLLLLEGRAALVADAVISGARGLSLNTGFIDVNKVRDTGSVAAVERFDRHEAAISPKEACRNSRRCGANPRPARPSAPSRASLVPRLYQGADASGRPSAVACSRSCFCCR